MPNPVQGGTVGRTDMGVDISGTPGATITNPVPGVSKWVNTLANWYKGQPLQVFQVISGPFAGKFWYVAEQFQIGVGHGQALAQGAKIGTYAASGTATEWGWAAGPSGQTLAQATTGYTEGQVTPAGTDFRNTIISARAGSRGVGSTTRTVQGWKVKASAESLGGTGSCGHGIVADGYSELSTVPMGTGSDFHALGGLACGTTLQITNPANGKSVQTQKQDIGAGSSFLPVMGLYPGTVSKLGLSGGEFDVIISRPDGGALHPVRGTPTTAQVGQGGTTSPGFGGSRPGGGNTSGGSGGTPIGDTAAVGKMFQNYVDLRDAPRDAAASGSVGTGLTSIGSAFQWWLSQFQDKANKVFGGT